MMCGICTPPATCGTMPKTGCGAGFGHLALWRLLSAPDHASGCARRRTGIGPLAGSFWLWPAILSTPILWIAFDIGVATSGRRRGAWFRGTPEPVESGIFVVPQLATPLAPPQPLRYHNVRTGGISQSRCGRCVAPSRSYHPMSWARPLGALWGVRRPIAPFNTLSESAQGSGSVAHDPTQRHRATTGR